MTGSCLVAAAQQGGRAMPHHHVLNTVLLSNMAIAQKKSGACAFPHLSTAKFVAKKEERMEEAKNKMANVPGDARAKAKAKGKANGEPKAKLAMPCVSVCPELAARGTK